MKLRNLVWLGCLMIFCQATAAGEWKADFEAAEEQATESGATLLVHFYADWCGPCRTMERQVLQTSDVRRALSHGLVGVKVNSDDRKDLVSRFGIRTLPSDVFVTSNGKISKFSGSPGRSGYVARLERFKARVAPIDKSLIAHTKPKETVRPTPELVLEHIEATQITTATHTTLQESDGPPTVVQDEVTIDDVMVPDVSQDEAVAGHDTVAPDHNETLVTKAVETNEDLPSEPPIEDLKSNPEQQAPEETVLASHERTDPSPDDTTATGSDGTSRDPDSAPADSAGEPKTVPVHRRTQVVKLVDDKKLGLDGYSPVSLSTARKWDKGRKQYRHEFQGVCYLLKDQQELDRFRAEPNRFIPVLHGYDTVALHQDGRLKTGAIELGATYMSRIYFFESVRNRRAFLQNPGQFARAVELSQVAPRGDAAKL